MREIACPAMCGGRRRSDGAPYTGTKPETADTAKAACTPPRRPDPTCHGQSPIVEESAARRLVAARRTRRRWPPVADVLDAGVLHLSQAKKSSERPPRFKGFLALAGSAEMLPA